MILLSLLIFTNQRSFVSRNLARRRVSDFDAKATDTFLIRARSRRLGLRLKTWNCAKARTPTWNRYRKSSGKRFGSRSCLRPTSSIWTKPRREGVLGCTPGRESRCLVLATARAISIQLSSRMESMSRRGTPAFRDLARERKPLTTKQWREND
jgi:hypothetical protein